MFKECVENVRNNVPLVHNITNYVTVNDVANVLLACGGSPIMSDDIDDVEDITYDQIMTSHYTSNLDEKLDFVQAFEF